MSSRMPRSLGDLPQELLEAIMTNIRHHADLSSLSRTSKKLHHRTSRTLYTNITMVWRGQYAAHADSRYHSSKVRQRRDAPTIDKLLRTLLEQPLLAEHLVSMDLESRGYRSSRIKYSPPKEHLLFEKVFDTSHTGLIRKAFDEIPIGDSDFVKRLIDGVLGHDLDAIIVLMLLKCHNLKHLAMDINIFRRNIYMSQILAKLLPGGGPRPLPYLRTIKLGTTLLEDETAYHLYENRSWTCPSNILRLSDYLPIFYISGLREATLCLPEVPYEITFEWPLSPPQLASLTALHLTDSMLHPESLHHILCVTPQLVTFTYEVWHDCGRFDAGAIPSALLHVRSTLQHLKINIEHLVDKGNGTLGYYIGDWVIGYCSLRNMLHLKTIAIPVCFLLGWTRMDAPALADVLPPNVTVLELWGDLDDADEYDWNDGDLLKPTMRKFFEQTDIEVTFPHLKKVELMRFYWEGGDDEIIVLAEHQGVKFAMTPNVINRPGSK